MRIHNYSFVNFKPKFVKDLIRLGNKKNDGGYVISRRQIGITKVLIGLGVNYDWTFEEDFKKENPEISIYCYDYSVGKFQYFKNFVLSVLNCLSINTYANIFYKKTPAEVIWKPIIDVLTFIKFSIFFKKEKKNYFFQQGISDHTDNRFITIDSMVQNIQEFNNLPDDSVFLKMDIEGSEYDILEDIIKYYPKINGLVIEFHNTKQLWSELVFLMEELKKHYEIAHIHGNNCFGFVPNTNVPQLFEVTLIKRYLLTDSELASVNSNSYPLADLDVPNFSNKPDLKLIFQ